ncbi:hypothetical protein COP2_011759 [Malus domestica]
MYGAGTGDHAVLVAHRRFVNILEKKADCFHCWIVEFRATPGFISAISEAHSSSIQPYRLLPPISHPG